MAAEAIHRFQCAFHTYYTNNSSAVQRKITPIPSNLRRSDWQSIPLKRAGPAAQWGTVYHGDELPRADAARWARRVLTAPPVHCRSPGHSQTDQCIKSSILPLYPWRRRKVFWQCPQRNMASKPVPPFFFTTSLLPFPQRGHLMLYPLSHVWN